jgi:hypothetical protein
MAHHMTSPDPDVRARAVGCVHNLSADALSLPLLLLAGCVPAVISLLLDPGPEVCRAAAGICQNLGREARCRAELQQGGATPRLLDLLVCSDVECQTAAVGALLNVLGPSLSPDKLPALRQALTDGIVMGVVNSCLFDPP